MNKAESAQRTELINPFEIANDVVKLFSGITFQDALDALQIAKTEVESRMATTYLD